MRMTIWIKTLLCRSRKGRRYLLWPVMSLFWYVELAACLYRTVTGEMRQMMRQGTLAVVVVGQF